MKKTYNVEKTFSGMRIDRWIRNSIKKIPQSLIEKNLRKGIIKLNGKKVKSSYKIKNDDEIQTTFVTILKKLVLRGQAPVDGKLHEEIVEIFKLMYLN